MARYDYLIVGAGFFGAVFAHEAASRGKRCLVFDKRKHVGGNAFCEAISSVTVHKYGPHIFHTSNDRVWRYINRFAEFNNFVNSPLASYHGKIYNLPFNMNTFNQLWGTAAPEMAKEKIAKQTARYKNTSPSNLEEQALALVGHDIYEIFIKGYTEKQWGRPCSELPPFLIKRIPLRFTYDNNYFNDRYQGIPVSGYNGIFKKLLAGCDIQLSTDFFAEKNPLALADKIVFTGMIDEYFSYRYGGLEYRTTAFETEELKTDNYQGNAVINYTDAAVPYTRIIEHKHFEFGSGPSTVITREYPAAWRSGMEPYYPLNDERNNKLYNMYRPLADKEERTIFGGRLAEYRYYNMDEVVTGALLAAEKELGINKT